MYRFIRLPVDGELVQVISRFVNKEFRITGDADRQEYLDRAARSLARTDCRALGFALMSSHVHWALVGGRWPLERLFRSLHSGFARYLNRSQGRLGPVFADRFRPFTYDNASALRLLAYLHNNPVRAGLVPSAICSTWTSHRYYTREVAAPVWLDVDLGLSLSGFAPDERAGFDKAVHEQREHGRVQFFGDDALRANRTEVRQVLQLPIELATSRQNQHELELPLMLRRGVPFRTPPNPLHVLDLVCEHLGVPQLRIAAKSHSLPAVAARRLALLVWQHLGGSQVVMAQHLGIGDSAASMLISLNRAAIAELRPLALVVANQLLNKTDSEKPFLKILKTV